MEEEITYQKAGVSIGEADAAKKEIAAYLKQSDARILNEVGPFASLFSATSSSSTAIAHDLIKDH